MNTNHLVVSAGQPSRPKRISRKLAVAAFAITSLFAVTAPAQASDRFGDRIAGTIVGAGIGAILGDQIGGHDGAKVGGLIGATVGLAATSHASHRNHRSQSGVSISVGHEPYYGNRYSHHPVYDNNHRAHKKAKKFKRGYRRGYNDGLQGFKGQTVRYSHDVEYDLSHRAPRYVRGYRVGYRDGLAQARKIERRRIRHQRRHQREELYYPNQSNHNYGKVRRVNKPVYREHKPRQHRRHNQRHGFNNYSNGADRP